MNDLILTERFSDNFSVGNPRCGNQVFSPDEGARSSCTSYTTEGISQQSANVCSALYCPSYCMECQLARRSEAIISSVDNAAADRAGGELG